MPLTWAIELAKFQGNDSCHSPCECHLWSCAVCNLCSCTCSLWPFPYRSSLTDVLPPPQYTGSKKKKYTGSFSWQSSLGMRCVCAQEQVQEHTFFPSNMQERERREKTTIGGTAALPRCWTDLLGGPPSLSNKCHHSPFRDEETEAHKVK